MIGKLLCAMGMHKTIFRRFFNGAFRPHFICSRKGCNYFYD